MAGLGAERRRRAAANIFSLPERVFPLPTHTVSLDLGSPINAISTSRDGGHVVVAGRNVFKVLTITSEQFEESHNLRVGRINLNFSHTDVQWRPENDQYIATAATNGAVVLWNLGKNSKNKQDHLYNDHNRTVNKVCFLPDGNVLLSGSQDGTVKAFDLRLQKAVQTFMCKTESIRDVQVNLHSQKLFAAALENGCVQLWDMRRPDQFEFQLPLIHSGPVFACEWHPDERHWIATAGRDKIIKVWDLQARQPRELYTVHTIASVARIRWRPEQKYEIASCALLLDFNVHVWDIRRPYIPYASFQEHRDVTTGIAWQRDPNYLLSCSKDNLLTLHYFDNAHRPAESAPPVGLAFSCHGHLSFALSDELKSSRLPMQVPQVPSQTGRGPGWFRKPSLSGEGMLSVRSSLLMFLRQQPTVYAQTDIDWMDTFQALALGYELVGSLTKLCEHNAEIAKKCGRPHMAQTWRILRWLYMPAEHSTSSVSSGFTSVSGGHDAPDSPSPGTKAMSTTGLSGGPPTPGWMSGEHRVAALLASQKGHDLPVVPSVDSNTDDNEGHVSEEDGEERSMYLSRIASGGYLDDDDDLGVYENSLPGSVCGDDDAQQNWVLPTEAFQLRQNMESRSPSPEHDKDAGLSLWESDSASVSLPDRPVKMTTPRINPVVPLTPLNIAPQEIPILEFDSVVSDMLNYVAEQGDVQMAVSILIVLGEKGRSLLPDEKQEQWYLAYVDLLSRFRLWTVSAQIIKLCPLQAVNSLNQDSTAVPSLCGRCSKPLGSCGWHCARCVQMTNTCSVCHQTVRGLYVWCQGCGHGGHVEHMHNWIKEEKWCPTGCGHKCEYM